MFCYRTGFASGIKTEFVGETLVCVCVQNCVHLKRNVRGELECAKERKLHLTLHTHILVLFFC